MQIKIQTLLLVTLSGACLIGLANCKGQTPETPTLDLKSGKPTVTALPALSPVSATGFDDVPMVNVPAGEFIMGSAAEDIARWENMQVPVAGAYNDYIRDEWPQMRVYLDEFEIDQYKVTFARYQRCVEAGVCSPPSSRINSSSHHGADFPDHPVLVLQKDALAYCQWVHKRLPTEIEWEKAARSTDGIIYPWGDVWDASRLQAGFPLAAVGSYPNGASPYGALDMVGNAPEWMSNQYRVYPGGLYTETAYFIDSHPGFVRRGGYSGSVGTESPPEILYRVANRFIGDDATPSSFRCVRGPEPPALEQAIVSVAIPDQPAPQAKVALNMVEVPAGEFQMGQNSDPKFPLHTVYLDTFYIDRYETTNAEYVEFLNALGAVHFACDGVTCVEISKRSGYDYFSRILEVDGQFIVEQGFEDYPVVHVTWEGAAAYCHWRGKRLPTDAEWEKAARGVEGLIYPWGDEWAWDKCAREPSPVGSYLQDVSPYGVWDMAGSVYEWVSDWYDPDYYSYSPERNPTGPDEPTSERIKRPGLRYGETFSRVPASHNFSFNTGVRCAYTP